MNWLIAHLIGDYIIQNDWMAQNKKSSTPHCLVHVALYTLSVAAFTWWPWWALLIVAVTHYIQDRTPIINWWMDRIGQKGFATHLAPWSVIVVDNTWHLLTLWLLSEAVKWSQLP